MTGAKDSALKHVFHPLLLTSGVFYKTFVPGRFAMPIGLNSESVINYSYFCVPNSICVLFDIVSR